MAIKVAPWFTRLLRRQEMKKLLALVFVSLWLVACSLEMQVTKGTGGSKAEDPSLFTADELRAATFSASKILLQRLPTDEELANAAEGAAAYEEVLRGYLKDPAFIDTMRNYHNTFFEMAGAAAGVNYNEPTNLALKIIRDDLDYRQIVLAKYCVNDALNEVPCSTFGGNASLQAEHASGILTTQGFLYKWKHNFNFRLVGKAFRVLACAEYPDGSDSGLDAADLGNDEGRRNFANSDTSGGLTNCYSCHRTINARTVPYFSYDRNGLYTTNKDTSTPHPDQGVSNAKISQLLQGGVTPTYHGKPLTKVRDYAEGIVATNRFKTCMVQRFRSFVFGKSHLEPLPEAMENLVYNVEANKFNVREVLVDIMTHPLFVKR